MRVFEKSELERLHKPDWESTNEDNGQVTIVGGSKLFHGAPLLSLKVASRLVDMVFFASPEPSVGQVAEQIKSKLSSFIWVPWEERGEYIKKSDAALIGPGFMRYKSEKRQATSDKKYDQAGKLTQSITKRLLTDFPNKKWVIDAGSLQVIDPELLPKGCVLTPNKKEYELLFKNLKPKEAAKRYQCTIVLKGPTDLICSTRECVEIKDGNPGMTKGGTGDVLAGLTLALLAKNEPFLAATAASYFTKTAADVLYKKVGINYNADDLADKIPETLFAMAK